jgi:hypothetical protein
MGAVGRWWSGVATGVAASATGGAAIATAWMATKTRDAADATKLDAGASRNAVIEMGKDRALAVRPILELEGLWIEADGGSLSVTDLGSSPAIGCRAVFRRDKPARPVCKASALPFVDPAGQRITVGYPTDWIGPDPTVRVVANPGPR